MRKLIKLPILLVVIFLLIMFLLDVFEIVYALVIPARLIVSIAFIGLGFCLLIVGGYYFRKAKTTFNPITPEKATCLVTKGIYHYSRNPMYIGFLLWLIAGVIYLSNLLNLFLLPVYILLVNKFYILPEERAMLFLFKDEFTNYTRQVRRWI